MFIYKITNKITGKMYIGLDSNINKTSRWSAHKTTTRKYIKNSETPKGYLYRAMVKYGIDCFDYEIIENNINSRVTLAEREIFYIQKYDTYNGDHYNMTIGGDGVSGHTHDVSDETKMKLAQIVKDEWNKYTNDEYKERCNNIQKGITQYLDSMTPEQYDEYIDKCSRAGKISNSKRTLQEKQEYAKPLRKWVDSLSPNERKILNDKISEGHITRLDNMTDKEKIEDSKRRSSNATIWWDEMSEGYSKTIRKKMSDKKKKKYIITSPDGIIYELTGIFDFCKKNKLHHGAMYAISNGKAKTYKGWHCKKAT